MKKTTAQGDVTMTKAEADQVKATQEEAQARKVLRNSADLWNAADKYIYQYINGVGLSILSSGVHSGKPKARACAKWSDSVWTEYYARKERLLSGEKISCDFSDIGPMPHSILELREEIESLWLL